MATAVTKARSFLNRAPVEALGDAVGLMAICLLVFTGFTLPALF